MAAASKRGEYSERGIEENVRLDVQMQLIRTRRKRNEKVEYLLVKNI